MERAQNARDGHNFGHKVEGRPESADRAIDGNELNTEKLDGRGERIRTSGPPGPEPGALARLSHAPTATNVPILSVRLAVRQINALELFF